MGLLDKPLRGLAKTLIDLLGGDATLTKTVTAYDAEHDLDTSTDTTYAVKISPPEPYAAYRIDGTLILAGDAKCLVAAKDLTALGIVLPPPSGTSYRLTIGEDRWTLVRMMELRSGDQAAAVELQLRR